MQLERGFLAAPVDCYGLRNDYASHVMISDGVDTAGVNGSSRLAHAIHADYFERQE